MVRRKREKIQNGQREIRGLKTRVGGGSAALAEGGQIVQWRGIQTRRVRGGSHSVTSGDTAGGSSRSESCQVL